MTQRNLIEILEASSPSRVGTLFWRELANIALRKFCTDTRALRSSYELVTVEDQQEYTLPVDVIEVLRVYTSDGSEVPHTSRKQFSFKPLGEMGWWCEDGKIVLGSVSGAQFIPLLADITLTVKTVNFAPALTEDNMDDELGIPTHLHGAIETRLQERNNMGNPNALQYLRGTYKEFVRDGMSWGHKQQDGGAFNVMLGDPTLR